MFYSTTEIIMEAFVIVAAIVAGLLLNAWNQRREHLVGDTPTTTSSTSTPPSFDNVIKIYRDNYLNFKTTGKQEYRVAYLSAQAQIEKYINDAEAKINSDGEEIKTFLQKYSDSGTKLQQYSSQANEVLRTGPEIGDQYTLEKKLREPVSVNMKPLYVKLGVAGLIALVGVTALLLK